MEGMKENFQDSLKLVLKSEGGNDDDPDDHGGRTSRGITQREYTAWTREQKDGVQRNPDVWKATDADIASIYHGEYWEPYCDDFPKGLDYLYFDMAVNAGPYRAATLLQRALHVAEDGRIGPITRGAVKNASPKELIDKFSDIKRVWYRALNQPKFTKGWLNRTTEVENAALMMLT
jgi:lysozyme family protein